MGGSIEVASELGRGSTFTIVLSLAEAKRREDVAKPASWTKVTGYEGDRRSLLVVDDNPANREMLTVLLAPLGFDVMLADSGEVALTLATARRPNLVLMDLAMPGMDGFETTRRFRKTNGLEGVVILACSAGLSDKLRQDCRTAGCDGFLAKPIDANQLLTQLGERLGLRFIYQQEDPALPEANSIERRPRRAPSAEALSRLIQFANQGRLQEFTSYATGLKEKDSGLAVWVNEACALCDSFALTELEAFLQSS